MNFEALCPIRTSVTIDGNTEKFTFWATNWNDAHFIELHLRTLKRIAEIFGKDALESLVNCYSSLNNWQENGNNRVTLSRDGELSLYCQVWKDGAADPHYVIGMIFFDKKIYGENYKVIGYEPTGSWSLHS